MDWLDPREELKESMENFNRTHEGAKRTNVRLMENPLQRTVTGGLMEDLYR